MLLIGWALWLGRDLINLDPGIWPRGGDFALTVQPYFQWRFLAECGSCVYWNGMLNGGYPAFVETHGSFLHPLTITTSLALGVVNGAKVSLVIGLILAGLAQWGLAKTMQLGLVARLWAGAVAVAGGNLSGRMEIGLIAIVLSTVFGALVMIPLYRLRRRPDQRTALLLGGTLALALLAGQGYVQVSIFIFVLTSFGLAIRAAKGNKRPVLNSYGLAVGITAATTAIFWIPFLRFLPDFGKEVDTSLNQGQPLAYLPFNLVIRDFDFFTNSSLEKIIFPAVHMNYIGWTAVLLALLATVVYRHQRQKLLFFMLPIGLIYLAASQEAISFLARFAPQQISSLRYPSLMIGIAVPLIIGLGAWGLDFLMKRSERVLELRYAARELKFPPLKAVIILLLILHIRGLYEFSDPWWGTESPPPESLPVALALQSDGWVRPPGEHFWMLDILARGQKTSQVFRPWHLAHRPQPDVVRYAERQDSAGPEALASYGPIHIYENADVVYSWVEAAGERVPCTGTSQGGLIQLECDSPQSGSLIIQENNYKGWRVWLDGEQTDLNDSSWLSTDAPEGKHQFVFRYQPWDVPLGLLVSLAGIVLAAYLWYKAPKINPIKDSIEDSIEGSIEGSIHA
jgi:hypothetical protein